MFDHVSKWFDGAGWFIGIAAACFIFALLAVLLELQTPNIVQWTGQQVTGSEQRGIVSYQWRGEPYTIDVPGYGSAKTITVYLDPGDPSHAMINDVGDRVEAVLLVVLPTAIGLVLLTLGGTRNYRWRRRVRDDPWEQARGQW